MVKKGFVYLIFDPCSELYKIGVTKNVCNKRLKQLQTGNATILELKNYHESSFPYRVESLVHASLKPKKILNEWYKLSPTDVANFKRMCDNAEKTIDALKDNPYFSKGLR
jgi:hypothetical protein